MKPTAEHTPVRTRSSVRTRIGILVAGVVALVVGIFAMAAYHEVRQSALELAEDRMFGAADRFAASLSSTAGQFVEDVRAGADEPAVARLLTDPTPEAREAALEAIRLTLPSGASVAELRDADGARILSTGTLPPSLDRPAPPNLAAAWVGPLVVDSTVAAEGAVFYPVSAVVGPPAAPQGTLTQWRRVDTAPQTRQMLEELIDPSARIFLTNPDGGIWTDFSRPVASRALPAAALDSRSLHAVETDELGSAFMATASAPPTPWLVVVQLPRNAVLARPNRMLWSLLLVGGVLLVGSVILGWILSGRLTLGLEALARAAGRISEGDYESRVQVGGADEVGVVADAFNRMAGRVGEAREALEEKLAELSDREAEAREMRDQLEHLISSSRAILFTHSMPRHPTTDACVPSVRWISDNVRWILAHEPSSVVEPGWWEAHLHPNDAPKVASRISELHARESVATEYRLRHGDGEYRWIRDERRLRSDAASSERDVVGVLTDITKRRELEVERATAEGANQAKTEFLSRMSHELRTPLTAVLGFAQLLTEDATDETTRQHASQVMRAGVHLEGLIEEVLDITGIEAGRTRLETEPVLAEAVVAEAVDLVRFQARERDIPVEVDPAGPDPSHWIQADPQRLRQILVNLLTNGIKYNRPGGRVRVFTETHSPNRVCIVVEDTGPGISAAHMSRLFVPFDRLGMEDGGPEGTGLGLPLSRTLAEAMDGSLEVESRLGEGSRFRVELPASGPATGDPGAEEAEHREAQSDGASTTGTVLLVEDHPANVTLIRKVFARRPDVELLVATRGDEAVRIARHARPDLVLLDLNLPDLGGDEVLSTIRDDPACAHTRVVMISGDASAAQSERLLALGAQTYLFKPFDIRELLQVVDRALRKPASAD